MKKFILAASILLVSSISHAVLVSLPDAQTSQARLSSAASRHFMERTSLHHKLAELAGKQIEAFSVVIMVDLALCDYDECIRTSRQLTRAEIKTMSTRMSMARERLVKLLLQDSPEAITELQRLGALE